MKAKGDCHKISYALKAYYKAADNYRISCKIKTLLLFFRDQKCCRAEFHGKMILALMIMMYCMISLLILVMSKITNRFKHLVKLIQQSWIIFAMTFVALKNRNPNLLSFWWVNLKIKIKMKFHKIRIASAIITWFRANNRQ